MLRITPGQLDYAALAKRARKLPSAVDPSALRVALLGNCALQQLVPLFRALFDLASVPADVYEGGYATTDAEVYNEKSPLYAFDPHFVIVFDSVQHVVDAYFSKPAERASFAAEAIGAIEGRWKAIERYSSASIVQTNLVLPILRVFGNYEAKVPGSLTDALTTINAGIVARAREHMAVFVNDLEFVASTVGKRAWFDDKLWVLSKTFCSLDHMPAAVQNAVDICLAAQGAVVKCVAVDLDNTMWGGVIGDDGVDGIRLGHVDDGDAFVAFQQFLLELTRRGVLLAVCSKNNHETAILPFREHPDMVLREKDITMFVANWSDKASNLEFIKDTLNIGYDAIVFLDDNPFERNLVRKLLPDVIVPELPEDPADYVTSIASLNLFETTSFSELDRQRADMYKRAALREETKHDFQCVDDYLRSLEMEIHLRRFQPFDLPRIAQLIQRSNQFNLATRRYSEGQCAEMLRDGERFYPISVNLKDRFGDYGLISVVIVRPVDQVAFIDEYLMSCRVLQRGVEQYVMSHVFEWARSRGLKRVEGLYLPTKKNAMVREFYKQFGFEIVGEEGGGWRWGLPIDRFEPQAAFMRPAAE